MNRKRWEEMNRTFEADFWGDCANTYGEETKQIAYAKVMGLDAGEWIGGMHWPVYDLEDRSVLDVGGGPSSMLLKSKNFTRGVVVDPCPYPDWVRQRYEAHGIELVQMPAEDYSPDEGFDEAWIYNVLQHTIEPWAVVNMMLRASSHQRAFEWIDVKPHPGHPHELRAKELEEWFGGAGKVVSLDNLYQIAETETGYNLAWGGWL